MIDASSIRQVHLPSPCDCYKCVGTQFGYYDDGHRYVKNNLLKHTLLEPCEECGRPKTEYRDLVRKGYYVCLWCNEREASNDE